MLEVLRELPKDQVVGTPESVARQRRIADALLAQGSDTSPIQSWTQGAARVAQALAGVYREHKADSAEKAGQASDKANLAALIGGAFGGGGSAGAPISGATAGASAPVDGAQAAAPVQMAADAAGKAEQLFQYLKSKGATDNEALMLTGAANNESSYNPKATHDPKNGVPTGYGLWGHNLGRLDLRGKDMFGQADAALAELKNRPEAQMLATAKTPEEITRAQMFYERPQGFTTRNPQGGHNYSGRLATLRALYSKYGTGGGAPQAPAGVQVASADPNFAPQMPTQAAPVGPGASLSPQDMATLTQRYAQAAPPPPMRFATPDGNIPPPTTTARDLTPADNFTERFNAGDPNALKPMALPPGAAVAPPGIPMPQVAPAAAPPTMTGTVAPPVAPPAAAMQAAPPGAKDSIIQSMIARGINPANGQPLQNPGVGRVVQALAAGGGAPQTVPAVSPAVQRVAGAMAPQAPPQTTGAPAAAQGASPQVAAAVQALANPYASPASKFMAQKIISDEMESRDPLRQLQVQKLQQELGGGTDDEKRMRQLQIQKAEKELAAPAKQWQKLDDGTLFDPATGEVKRIDAGGAAPLFKGTSVEAQSLNGLVAAGKLTPEQAMQIGAGKTVTDPSTGAVIFMTPQGIFGQAPGQPPQPLAPPTGAPPQAAPAPQQNPGLIPITAPKPVKASESEKNAMTYADRMQQSGAILDALGTKGTGLQDQIFSQVPLVGNSMVSEDFQKVDQAKRDFINAQLRRESGAAISEGEFQSANKQYFPQRGDTEDVIAQKAQNRKTVIAGMIRDGGPTYQGAAPAAAPTQDAPPLPGAVKGEDGTYWLKNPDPASQQTFMPILSDPSLVKRLKSGTRFATPDGRTGVAP